MCQHLNYKTAQLLYRAQLDRMSSGVSRVITSHSTHNRSFRIQVFPANHLAMVLTKQTYNNQDKYKKPKDIHKKPQKLNLTKPN